MPARTAPARRSCEQPLRPERLRAWPARSVATQSRVVGILGNGWWAESVLLDTRERSYANTVYPGGDKHALRTSCCAVATFALLVVLGVACIVKNTCACRPALASEEIAARKGDYQRERPREPMLGEDQPVVRELATDLATVLRGNLHGIRVVSWLGLNGGLEQRRLRRKVGWG